MLAQDCHASACALHAGRSESKPRWEVADIFRLYGQDYRKHYAMTPEGRKVMNLMEICRTAVLGGHVLRCDHCGIEHNAYNSCCNRHCNKCQTLVKEKWLNDRKAELLPASYFHLVFTLPHTLNPLILCNKRVCLNILFDSVNETLQAFAKDPQWRLEGKLGFTAILHTWNQTVLDHFHLHCLIPAGALSFDNSKWTAARENFLFRAGSLGKEFSKRYIKKLGKAYQKQQLVFPPNIEFLASPEGFSMLKDKTRENPWIVYAKRPFAGPEQVLQYLGRYTHRVAISNERIQSIDNEKITFTYKDRKNNNQTKTMTLEAHEFIRRFLLHVLPDGFMKIRYFGFLSHRNKARDIALIRKLIDPQWTAPKKTEETIQEMMLRLTGIDITICSHCRQGRLFVIGRLLPQKPADTS